MQRTLWPVSTLLAPAKGSRVRYTFPDICRSLRIQNLGGGTVSIGLDDQPAFSMATATEVWHHAGDVEFSSVVVQSWATTAGSVMLHAGCASTTGDPAAPSSTDMLLVRGALSLSGIATVVQA